jgi:alpha-aminoadipic semialdehyde synthase
MLLRSRMHHAKYSVKRLSRSYATAPLTIGIRREDPERIWERRCPLTPDAVHELVKKENIQVLIQDCDRRVFPMAEFVKVRGGRGV